MTKSQLRKYTQDCLDAGKSKHETYEELKLMTSMKPEEVANIVQAVPNQKLKDLNQVPQILLLIVMGIYVASHAFILYVSLKYESVLDSFWPSVRFLAGLLLFFGFMLCRIEAYRVAKIWMGLGLLRFTTLAFLEGNEWLHLVDMLLLLSLVILTAYLEIKLFPSYRIVKELYQNRLGEDRLRNTIRFDD